MVDPGMVDGVMEQIAGALAQGDRRPVVIGLCGAQGSGKSTLADAVAFACVERGLRCAVLSIDDLYLTRAERQALAREVHPLCATRGVPGTHDVALGLTVLSALEGGDPVPLPRFDKARDDRAPVEDWPSAPEHCEVLLFEGWCVGAGPQEAADLHDPANSLEREEDAEAVWRSWANRALAGPYRALFARIDRLVLLAAPDFAVVAGWRLQQERELAARHGVGSSGADDKVMDAAGIARFVSHYERITRHILAEMPGRADLVVDLDEERRVRAIRSRR